MEWLETQEQAIREMIESANDLLLNNKYKEALILISRTHDTLNTFIRNCEVLKIYPKEQSGGD